MNVGTLAETGVVVRFAGLEGVEAGLKQAAAATESAGRRMAAAADRNAKAFSDAFVREQKRVVNSSRALDIALRTLAAGLTIREVIQYADAWTLTNGRLALVSKSTEGLIAVQRELFTIAQATRTSYGETANLYAKTARAATGLGASQKDVLAVTKAINQAFIVSGASTQEQTAALIQLGQAFQSGTLRGDELRSVLEQAPRLAQAIAVGMGTTVGQLRKLGEEGKLTSAAVFNALRSQAGAIDAEFKRMPTTVGQSLTVLQNSLTQFIGRLSDATGGSKRLAETVELLARNLPTVAAAVGAIVTAWLAYNVAVRLATVWNALLTAGQTVAAFLSLAKTVRSAADAMALLQIAGKGAAGAVAAVAALTIGFLAYKKVLEEINKESDKFTAKLDGIQTGAGFGAPPPADMTAHEKSRARALLDEAAARDEMIRKAREELQLLELSADVQEEQRVHLEAQRDIRAANVAYQKALIGASKDEATQAAKTLAADLEAIERRRDAELATVQRRHDLRDEDQAHLDALEDNNAALKEQKRLYDEATEAAIEGLKKELEYRKEIRKELLRGLDDIATNGLRSWESFFDSVFGLFRRLLSRMEEAGKTSGAAYKLLGLGAAGVGGAIAGFQIGSRTTNSALGALGGAASGAAAGAAFGPWGAAIGGLLGAGAGLLGSAKAQKEAAEKLREASEALAKNEAAFIAQNLGNNGSVAGRMAQLEDTYRTLAESLAKLYSGTGQYNDYRQRFDAITAARDAGIQAIRFDFISDIGRQFNELSGPAGAYANQLDAIQKQYVENMKNARALGLEENLGYEIEEIRRRAIEAANKALQESALRQKEDLQIRQAVAAGNTFAAQQLRDEIARRRELADAVKDGADAETLAMIELTQAMEAAAAAAERAQHVEDVRNDARIRLLEATGRSDEAAVLRQQIDHARELREAIVDGLDDATLAALRLAQAAEEAALAANQARDARRALDDLEVRRLTASGNDRGAEDLRFALDQAKELEDALAGGKSQEYIDKLREVLALEKASRDQKAAGAAATADDTARALRDAKNVQVRDAQSLSETTGLRMVDELASIREAVQSLDRKTGGYAPGNTASLTAPGTGGTFGGGMVVNLYGDIYVASDVDPEAAGAGIIRGAQRELGKVYKRDKVRNSPDRTNS